MAEGERPYYGAGICQYLTKTHILDISCKSTESTPCRLLGRKVFSTRIMHCMSHDEPKARDGPHGLTPVKPRLVEIAASAIPPPPRTSHRRLLLCCVLSGPGSGHQTHRTCKIHPPPDSTPQWRNCVRMATCHSCSAVASCSPAKHVCC